MRCGPANAYGAARAHCRKLWTWRSEQGVGSARVAAWQLSGVHRNLFELTIIEWNRGMLRDKGIRCKEAILGWTGQLPGWSKSISSRNSMSQSALKTSCNYNIAISAFLVSGWTSSCRVVPVLARYINNILRRLEAPCKLFVACSKKLARRVSCKHAPRTQAFLSMFYPKLTEK